MRKLLKGIGYTLLSLAALLLLYLGSARALSRLTVPAEQNTPHEITMYLLSNGVHTGLVVPVRTADEDWSKDILFRNARSGDTDFNYVAFGWGDKGFYLETPTWDDLTFRTAFRTTFGLGTSPIHATFTGT